MAANKKATSVRYPESLLERAAKIAARLTTAPPDGTPPGKTFTRTDVLLLAVDLGLKQMESGSSARDSGVPR